MRKQKKLKVLLPSFDLSKEIDLTPIDEQKSLLELLLKQKIPIHHSCGGNGLCGTCRVLIESKSEPVKSIPMGPFEQEFWQSHGYSPTHPERLSCQIPIEALPNQCVVRLII